MLRIFSAQQKVYTWLESGSTSGGGFLGALDFGRVGGILDARGGDDADDVEARERNGGAGGKALGEWLGERVGETEGMMEVGEFRVAGSRVGDVRPGVVVFNRVGEAFRRNAGVVGPP